MRQQIEAGTSTPGRVRVSAETRKYDGRKNRAYISNLVVIKIDKFLNNKDILFRMYALAIIHFDEIQAQEQGTALRAVLNEAIERKFRVYNFPHWSNPAQILQPYREHMVDIPYRGGDIGEDDYTLFLDGKLRMMNDGVEKVHLGGQSIFMCVKDLAELLEGKPQGYWPSAERLGWDKELREKVLRKRISAVAVPEILM